MKLSVDQALARAKRLARNGEVLEAEKLFGEIVNAYPKICGLGKRSRHCEDPVQALSRLSHLRWARNLPISPNYTIRAG